LIALKPEFSFCQDGGSSGEIIEDAIAYRTLRRGIYASFLDFQTNSPSNTLPFYLEEKKRNGAVWEGMNSITPWYTHNDMKVKKVWGFCDGEKAYIYHQKEFFEVVLENDKLFFHGYDLIDKPDAANIVMIGGVAAAVYSIETSVEAKAKKIRYLIHSDSGVVNHLGEIKGEFTKELVIYRRSKKEALENFVFSLDDSLKYTFSPDSYVLLKYRSSDLEIQICFGSSFDNCNNVSLENKGTTFVKCSIAEGTSIVTVAKVDEDEGWFDWAKVEKIQDKRGPQVPVLIDRD